MDNIMYKAIEIVHYVGMPYAVMLLVLEVIFLVVIFLVGVVYLVSLMGSYTGNTGTIKSAVNYGDYKVEIKRGEGEIEKTICLKAWNKINAIERAAKKSEISEKHLLKVEKI